MEASLKLNPPFREADLLTVEEFIQFCLERGVSATEEELELYEKIGLLYPAVRVKMSIGRFQAVTLPGGGSGFTSIPLNENFKGQIYYATGGIAKDIQVRTNVKIKDNSAGKALRKKLSEGSDEEKIHALSRIKKNPSVTVLREMNYGSWLDRDMCEYPSQQAFRPWREYTVESRDFVLDKKMLGTPKKSYYDPRQILTLIFLQEYPQLKVYKTFIFSDSESMLHKQAPQVSLGENYKLLKEGIFKMESAVSLSLSADNLERNTARKIGKIIKKHYREEDNYSKIDARQTLHGWDRSELPKKSGALLSKYRIDLGELGDLIEKIMRDGLTADPFKGQIVAKNIPNTLAPDSYITAKVLLAEQYYQIVKPLVWLMKSLDKQTRSFEALQVSIVSGDMKSLCEVCQKPISFNPRRRGGQPQRVHIGKCKKEYNKRKVKQGRASGKYR